jgi:hypothetical protein
VTVDKRKFLTILKNLYSGETATINAARKAQELMEDKEAVAFATFQFDVGALFIELKEELDQGLEDLAPVHPEEPDPRKWDFSDWFQFEQTTKDHPFYEIYKTMGKGEANINLIWDVIEDRIDFS